MELKDFKDVVRVMTKEEFESTIEEDIKFVEGFKNFLKHDDATRIVEHIKSVLEASVDYHYPNHPEVEFEKDFGIIHFRLVTHLYRMNTFYWIAGIKTPCYFYKLDE